MARGRWSKFVVVAVAAVVLSMASSAVAGAAGEADTGGYGFFSLEASHGYEMLVLANSRPEYREGEIGVWLLRKDEAALYYAPATVTDTEIRADLGNVGRIAVDFKPTGKGKTAPKCMPRKKVSYEKGFYEGEIEFHGEEGFADVSATRAPFSFHPAIDLVCGAYTLEEAIGRGFPGARLTARARLPRGGVSLQVNQNRPGARVEIEAEVRERHGRVEIARVSDVTYPATSFRFDPRLRSASLRPPAPFSGSALYRRDAKPSNRWTGSLAVDLPGRSGVSLTGDRFRALLVHARRTRGPFVYERPALSREEPGRAARALFRRSRYLLR